MQASIVFSLRVQCRRKENSRSLSHLLMSFLYIGVRERRHRSIEGPDKASLFSVKKSTQSTIGGMPPLGLLSGHAPVGAYIQRSLYAVYVRLLRNS